MAINQKYIDDVAEQIASMPDALQLELVRDLRKLSKDKRFKTIDEFLFAIEELDLDQIVNLKAQYIVQGYAVAQQQILTEMSLVAEITEETLRALTNFSQTSFADSLGSMGKIIKSELIKGIIGETTDNGIFQAIQQQSGLSNKQMATLVRTGLNDYGASVNKIMMDNADESQRFRYIGPIDDKTRPFCIKVWEAGAMTRKEIKQKFPDNGQGGSTELQRGGYNCRHQFVPIEAEDKTKDFRTKNA